MTAPDMFLAADPDGRMTLWADDGLPTPVAWLDGQRIHIDPVYAGQAWQALTAVLAPDEATIERLAEAVYEAWPDTSQPAAISESDRAIARNVLAALAGTSAQARHTDDETGGGA